MVLRHEPPTPTQTHTPHQGQGSMDDPEYPGTRRVGNVLAIGIKKTDTGVSEHHKVSGSKVTW